ncbi:MAG: pyruvate carboxylase subunit B, partial [Firmicutes bacterium]|nr:pyruvate carboxylase subunit B [Bacillota bacterium]
MKSVKICDATLRDGQQSLIATRMRIEEIQPILAKMDEAGFYSMEVWGGATFDSCLRYLREDPWDRLRKIRSAVKNTKLQMLLRGQNILGYKNYSDDVVEMFVRKSIENGIDILRIFDALNDVRNLETAVKATKKENAHAQLAISYTLSDVHTLDYYVELGKQLENIGADSICIKDMAGLLLPLPAYELVKALKENVSVPIEVHSHYTSGVASMTYLKAIEAGADIIDT